MKKKIAGIFVMGLMIGTIFAITNTVSACTGFTTLEDENVLVGINFDWSRDFNVYMNFLPAEEGKFGRVIFDIYWPWFGDPHGILPIQGMNDQGLFYDTYMTPYLKPVNSKDKPIFESDDPDFNKYGWMGILPYCLAKCTVVSEVLDIINQYNLEDWTEGQVFFVDINGDSVIIEGDDIIPKDGNFQVVTNFLQSHPELGGYPCWRYDAAVSMLESMSELTVNYFRSICDTTHLDTTVYSNIYDLNQEIFYVNYYNNFEKTLEFDLNEELAKGRTRTYLGSLFEPDDNQAPLKPDSPTGDETGIPGTDYRYSCKKTSDPDGDRIMYLFDWGDGTDSGWIVPQFGTIKAYHNWTERGNFEVKVKAMDVYGRESEWSDPLSVTMPKNKIYISTLILNFLENHPIIYQLIQRFLKL